MPEFVKYLRQRNWTTLFGYALFTGMMAAGYYYNLTFVQLGLVDLGTRVVGMSEGAVSANMAALALTTCVVAIASGVLMQKRGWGERSVLKLRLAFGAVLMQTLLTLAAPLVHSGPIFTLWVIVAGVALGLGVPVMFGMAVDLIPTRDRGYVAAAITGLAYFAAAGFSSDWRIEQFTSQVWAGMLLGTVGLGLLAFRPYAFVESLAKQHTLPQFAVGRFVSDQRQERARGRGRELPNRTLIVFVVLMFGIYFVDSLGFLWLLFTPDYMMDAWQSPELSPHLVIAAAHVVGAFIAGVLYSSLGEKALFGWTFGIFSLVHLMYVFDLRLATGNSGVLAMPILYALAVSLYTVVNFAVWADLSTPKTISVNTAVGVALSGFAATFVSTALAIQWKMGGMDVERHLSIVASLAGVLFIVSVGLLYWQKGPKGGSNRNGGDAI